MIQLRSSLIVLLGTFGIGLGAAGGCADGAKNLPKASGSGAGGTAQSGGGSGLVTSGAGDSTVAGSGNGGSTVVSCGVGERRCGPNCVDVSNNPLHCGDCGRPCPAEARECVGGTCLCPSDTHAVCDGICTDLRTDPSNCGTCGNICSSDKTCSAGACICDPNKSANTPCGTKCVDLMTDAFHCGSCNTTSVSTCDAAQVCNQGVCASTCTAPDVKCGAKCANLQSDSANCSECGKACDATRMCSGGTCVCATGRKLCGTACADTQTDSKNCGACGNVCTPGTECSKGVCVCKSNATKCSVAGTGGAGGSAGAPSSIICVDTTVDPKNCGACGESCTAAESCIESACSCVAPNVECGTPATCTDLQTNASHCGSCDHACNAVNEHCASGACVCTAPNVDCGSGCVDTSKTAAHCGGCNQPCTGNQICSNGICVSGDIRVYTKLQSVPASAADVKNSITLSVRICNSGTTTANLSGAKITYWYSMDGAAGQQIATSPYSSLAGVTVDAVPVEPMRGDIDYALVATLPTGATAALAGGGACFDEIQMSVHAGTTWVTGYDLTNDWSYLGQATFTLNTKVTMNIGAAKMWGNEPPSQ